MKTLNKKKDVHIKLQSLLVRIVDIVNFEGPLLSLFENKEDKQLYLFDWVDRDAQYNRWLIYPCKIDTIDKFINGKISHYDLFMANEEYFCAIDIDRNLAWNNISLVEKNMLPESYFPNKDVFFEECDCPNFYKLDLFVKNRNKKHNSKNIFIPEASEIYDIFHAALSKKETQDNTVNSFDYSRFFNRTKKNTKKINRYVSTSY